MKIYILAEPFLPPDLVHQCVPSSEVIAYCSEQLVYPREGTPIADHEPWTRRSLAKLAVKLVGVLRGSRPTEDYSAVSMPSAPLAP